MTYSNNETLEEYKTHLSDELRKLFDAKGYELVHEELINNCYQALEKRKAAIAWMAEQRKKKKTYETIKYYIPLTLSFISIIISIALKACY